jgi:hypothetical protein
MINLIFAAKTATKVLPVDAEREWILKKIVETLLLPP